MPCVLRYAGGLCGVVLVLAVGCGAGAAAAVPVPEGPRLAFIGTAGIFKPSDRTIRTVGTDSPQPLVVVRGSQKGVVPSLRDGMSWSADGSLLAFTGSRKGRRGIYTVHADGTDPRFLRGTRGGSNPVFSPDGLRIAFSREHLGKGVFPGTTPWVASVDGSRAHRLAEWRRGVEYIPSSFSPDGSALAVTRRMFFDPNQSAALLFALDGSGDRRPLVRFPASEPVFSPDGSQVVLVRHSILRRGKIRSSHSDLFLVDPFGGNLRRLTDTRWIAETHPSWDPSGQRIAFTSFHISRDPLEALFDELIPFGNSIVQINADGTCREKLLSLRDAATYGARWQPGQGRGAGRITCGEEPVASRAPAGSRLALVKFNFFSFRFELDTVDEAGARPFPLAGGGEWKRPLPEWFAPPAWSPDGSSLVFAGMARRLFGGSRGTRLYAVEADGTDLYPLRGTHGAFQPVFSPNGHTVAFGRVQFRESRDKQGKKIFVPRSSSIWLADLAGGAPRRLTPARNGHYLYPNSFSPDGSTLLATREVGSRPSDAVALTLGGGGTRTVIRHALDPIYSPDGSRIAFVRKSSLKGGSGDASTTLDLFIARADGGGVRRLTSGAKDDVFQSWDPSGERIAFVRYRPEETESDEIGIGSAIMEVNADGSCLHAAVAPSRGIAFYGAAWQPGPGREAGRIAC
jgi:Tol biopolymer transport system component